MELQALSAFECMLWVGAQLYRCIKRLQKRESASCDRGLCEIKVEANPPPRLEMKRPCASGKAGQLGKTAAVATSLPVHELRASVFGKRHIPRLELFARYSLPAMANSIA